MKPGPVIVEKMLLIFYINISNIFCTFQPLSGGEPLDAIVYTSHLTAAHPKPASFPFPDAFILIHDLVGAALCIHHGMVHRRIVHRNAHGHVHFAPSVFGVSVDLILCSVELFR